MCPVMAAPSDHADALRLYVECYAVAVPFDFIGPFPTNGRLCFQKRKAWFDTIGHRIKWEMRLRRVAWLASAGTQRLVVRKEGLGSG